VAVAVVMKTDQQDEEGGEEGEEKKRSCAKAAIEGVLVHWSLFDDFSVLGGQALLDWNSQQREVSFTIQDFILFGEKYHVRAASSSSSSASSSSSSDEVDDEDDEALSEWRQSSVVVVDPDEDFYQGRESGTLLALKFSSAALRSLQLKYPSTLGKEVARALSSALSLPSSRFVRPSSPDDDTDALNSLDSLDSSSSASETSASSSSSSSMRPSASEDDNDDDEADEADVGGDDGDVLIENGKGYVVMLQHKASVLSNGQLVDVLRRHIANPESPLHKGTWLGLFPARFLFVSCCFFLLCWFFP